jgi:hypothetical protein
MGGNRFTVQFNITLLASSPIKSGNSDLPAETCVHLNNMNTNSTDPSQMKKNMNVHVQ